MPKWVFKKCSNVLYVHAYTRHLWMQHFNLFVFLKIPNCADLHHICHRGLKTKWCPHAIEIHCWRHFVCLFVCGCCNVRSYAAKQERPTSTRRKEHGTVPKHGFYHSFFEYFKILPIPPLPLPFSQSEQNEIIPVRTTEYLSFVSQWHTHPSASAALIL